MTGYAVKLKLEEKTRDLWANRPRGVTYAIAAQETGLTARWIEHFAQNNGNGNYSVTSVETLYVYLTGEPLNV
jgi:hypothetical protein